jgi:2C-methyl-D-erythritol 2,4-cyclodiphosphate synthase
MSDTIRPERRALYEALQMHCAGHSVEDVLHALCDSLSSAVGLAATDYEHACQIIDTLPADLKRTIQDNWDHLREMRGHMLANRERAHA